MSGWAHYQTETEEGKIEREWKIERERIILRIAYLRKVKPFLWKMRLRWSVETLAEARGWYQSRLDWLRQQ